MRTVWLSFCDPDRPKGQRFLGVAIVDVTDEEVEGSILYLHLHYPKAQPGAEVIHAAMRKAHETGCNPGGEVNSWELSEGSPELSAPRNRLMQQAELEILDLVKSRK